ncbi:MAG TPA: hypothetical protein VMI93_15215 [Candidatus Solibacter sp.]|nr:hypothetical protein [Candidatus Solibacter sp.]
MLGHRQLSAAEYLGIWRRRWKLVLASLLLGSAAGYLLARIVPSNYVSTATVTQVVRGSYGAAGPPYELTDSRLSALRQQAITRDRMEALAARYGLNGQGGTQLSGSDAIAQFQRNISVSPAEAGFSVSFTAGNPRTAQQVCAELVSLLMQEEIKNLQRDGGSSTPSANPVTGYLTAQIADAKHVLDERDAKLAEFKRQHAGELGGPERSLAEGKITEYETQLQATDAALKRAMQQRTTLTESLFVQQSAALQSRKPADSSGVEALEEQLAEAQAQLVTLETRYTPDHPDVVKLRSDIAQLQKKLEEAKKSAGTGDSRKSDAAAGNSSAHLAQVQAQIRELDALIQEKSREEARLQQELLAARSRLDSGSRLNQEYRELTAESASARTFYTSLLARQSEAQKAAPSGGQQVEGPLRISVPPNLPERPAYPNPWLFTLGGAGSGFALGLLAMVAGEMSDKSMRTARDIEHFLELPTLAVIPPAGTEKGTGMEAGTGGGRMGNRGEKEESVLADV